MTKLETFLHGLALNSLSCAIDYPVKVPKLPVMELRFFTGNGSFTGFTAHLDRKTSAILRFFPVNSHIIGKTGRGDPFARDYVAHHFSLTFFINLFVALQCGCERVVVFANALDSILRVRSCYLTILYRRPI